MYKARSARRKITRKTLKERGFVTAQDIAFQTGLPVEEVEKRIEQMKNDKRFNFKELSDDDFNKKF